jgi:hypothetical protein
MARQPKSSDWGTCLRICANVFDHFGKKRTIDLHASDEHHVADRFVSQFYKLGCLAVNANRLDWGSLVGQSELAMMGVSACPRCEHGAILIESLVWMPICTESGSIEMVQLDHIVGARKSRPFLIFKRASSRNPSGRVPHDSLNPAFLGLGIIRITWSYK